MVKLSESESSGSVLILLALACAVASSSPTFAADNPSADNIEALVERSHASPYPGEMVLLKVRMTLFGRQVALNSLEQPALENFSWVQLGPDRWSRTEVDGEQAVRLERILALFPEKSGRLNIDAFIDRLTVTDDNNARRMIELRSPPVNVDVQPWTAAKGGPDDRDASWLPAKSLTLDDKWEPDPEQIKQGEMARRTVVIEADGISADRLPPTPKLLSPGVTTFARPAERKTILSSTGPKARAIYRWDVRPATKYPARLEGIHIQWFDTKSRLMRDTIMPGRRIAFARTAADGPTDASRAIPNFPVPFTWLIAGLTGFGMGLAILFPGHGSDREMRVRRMGRLRAWWELRFVRHAAWSGEVKVFRLAIFDLARRDVQHSRRWLAAPVVLTGLEGLDRYLFGASRGQPLELNVLAKNVQNVWFDTHIKGSKRFPLKPLDGESDRE